MLQEMYDEKIEAGILLYENKNDQQLHEIVVRLEDYRTDVLQIHKRYKLLNRYRKNNRLSGFECSLLESDYRFKQCAQKDNCIAEMKKGNYPQKDVMNTLIVRRYDSRKGKFFKVKKST
jgi:hypothetical protein